MWIGKSVSAVWWSLRLVYLLDSIDRCNFTFWFIVLKIPALKGIINLKPETRKQFIAPSWNISLHSAKRLWQRSFYIVLIELQFCFSTLPSIWAYHMWQNFSKWTHVSHSSVKEKINIFHNKEIKIILYTSSSGWFLCN